MQNITPATRTLKLPRSPGSILPKTSNTTPRMKLPYLVASQAQKEITHNEALEKIDVLLHAFALAIENIPPDVPAQNDCYIVGTEPHGEWANYSNALAYYTNGWNFIDATEGMTVWVCSNRCHYTYDGISWSRSFSGRTNSLSNSIDEKEQPTELDRPDVALPVAIVPTIVPEETCPAEDLMQLVTDTNDGEEL